MTVNVPDGLVYGQTGGKQLTCTVEPGKDYDVISWRLSSEDGPLHMEPDDTFPADMPAGDYQLKVRGIKLGRETGVREMVKFTGALAVSVVWTLGYSQIIRQIMSIYLRQAAYLRRERNLSKLLRRDIFWPATIVAVTLEHLTQQSVLPQQNKCEVCMEEKLTAKIFDWFITTKCTMNCKLCAAAVPYIRNPKHTPKEIAFKELHAFFTVWTMQNVLSLLAASH